MEEVHEDMDFSERDIRSTEFGLDPGMNPCDILIDGRNILERTSVAV